MQDVVYLDPPYQGTSGRRRRYHGDFSHDELWQQLADLVERRVPFALLYDGMTGEKAYGRQLSNPGSRESHDKRRQVHTVDASQQDGGHVRGDIPLAAC